MIGERRGLHARLLAVAVVILSAGCHETGTLDPAGSGQANLVAPGTGPTLVALCHENGGGDPTIILLGPGAAAAHVAHGDKSAPCVPRLLSPLDGALLAQNNASEECSAHPTRGTGIKIVFDWAHLRDPRGRIAGYILFAKNANATFPIIANVFTPEARFTFLNCNAFVDRFLSGWEWKVRSVDLDGNLSEFSPVQTWAFAPCRLEDGSPCHT